MSAQTTPITERQLELITRAHCDAGGLIEPLLTLKGGAKLKMIASLAQRGDRAARRPVAHYRRRRGHHSGRGQARGHAGGGERSRRHSIPSHAPLAIDPELEAAVVAAEASWQAVQDTPRVRADSKQAQVIALLQRPQGTSIAEIMAITGWQAHSVRGLFAGTLKKRGIVVTSEKAEGGGRVYRAALLSDAAV